MIRGFYPHKPFGNASDFCSDRKILSGFLDSVSTARNVLNHTKYVNGRQVEFPMADDQSLYDTD